jgi:hypothetical protein
MKFIAKEFFNMHLQPAFSYMELEVGTEEALYRFAHMKLDLATQSSLSGHVVCVKPNGIQHMPFAIRRYGVTQYPMFGKLASGFGGCNVVAQPGNIAPGLQVLHHINVYPGGWVHHLKGGCMPLSMVANNLTMGWLSRQRGKLQHMLLLLGQIHQTKLGGCRVEVRTNGAITQ